MAARRTTLAAAFALVLAVAACSSSGSSGAARSTADPSTAGSSTPAEPVTSTSPTSAPTTGAGSPSSAHAVPASAYQVGTDDYHGTAHAMPGVVQFTTPSGNIGCTYLTGPDPQVACSLTAHDFALPARPASCTLDWAGGLMTLDDHATVLGHCVGDSVVTFHSRTLAYGDVLTSRGIACSSGRDALTCMEHGRGFALSREAAHTF